MRTHSWARIVVAASILTCALGVAADSSSDKKTFYRDVLPILQAQCQDCHRPGGTNMGGMVAPMAFTDYGETRPWAKAIARAVESRVMPPWHASEQHRGVFHGERYLSQDEIDTIVAWVNQGAPAGSPTDAPPAREFPEVDGWSIGEPDLVIQMPKPFFVPDELLDDTYYFPMTITEEMLPEDRWMKAIEFRPDSRTVHHIFMPPIGGMAPGNAPTVYKDGYSARLHVGEKITWNMHYHKEPGPGSGEWDQSSAALVFYPKGYVPEHVLVQNLLGTMTFRIPAYDPAYQASVKMTFEHDALIYALTPHMHYRGKAAKYTLTYPDGTSELLLDVPRYDFNWQTQYRFKEPKFVPQGTKVELIGIWDNSEANPYNPDPSRTVTFGEATHEEMLFGGVEYTNPAEGADGRSGIEFGFRKSMDSR